MAHSPNRISKPKTSKSKVGSKPPRGTTTRKPVERAEENLEDRCGTRLLQHYLEGRYDLADLRRRIPNLLPAPGPPNAPNPPYASVPASGLYETAHFSIRYWYFGIDAVDLTANGGPILDPRSGNVVGWIDKDLGVPDYIQRIAFWLEKSWSVYSSPPISMIATFPSLIDVSVDHRWPPALGTGINITIGIENDYLALVCAHEVFHLFQLHYATPGAAFADENLIWSISEGGADLAVDFVLDALNYYVATERVLSDPLGWTPYVRRGAPGQTSYVGWPYPYSMFLKYYVEQSIDFPAPSNPALFGGNALRILYESCHANGYGRAGVSVACNAVSNARRTLADFSYIGNDVQCGETLLGNFWLALYLKDLPASGLDRRFTLRENVEGIPALAVPRSTLAPGGQIYRSESVREYTALIREIQVDPAVARVTISMSANKGTPQSIFEVALIDPFGHLIDVFRTSAQKWTHSFATQRDGRRVDRIYAVAASSDTWIVVDMLAEPAAPAPDITITPWNCLEATHYETDPLVWSWMWLSPDIWLDNQGLGRSSGVLNAGQVNQLSVRLRNQGNADTSNISVDVDYQSAAVLPLDPGAWQPIRASDGSVSRLTALALDAGGVEVWSLPWAIPANLADTPVAVRVTISCPDDDNVSNKVAMTILSYEVDVWNIPIERKLPIFADPLYDPPRHRIQTFTTGPRAILVDPLSTAPVSAKKTRSGVHEKYELRLDQRRSQYGNERLVAGKQGFGRNDARHPPAPAPGSLPPGSEQLQYLTVHYPSARSHAMGLSLMVSPKIFAAPRKRAVRAKANKVKPPTSKSG